MKSLFSAILLWSATTMSLQAKPIVEPKISPDVIPIQIKQGTPHEINYQGWLGAGTDTTGITDTLGMIFRIYTTPTGGSPVWDEAHIAVPVIKGIFNIYLGESTPLSANIFTGAPLWIETQVSTDTLSPRKKLVSVGYAIKSEYSDTATYALGANVQYVDSARVATNSWRWNNNTWGTEYPQANRADTALYVAGANVVGEVAQANHADTADYAIAAAPDTDWIISGSNMYSGVSGNVGIGKTDPMAPLEVYSSNLGIPKFAVGDLYGWQFEINADGKAGVLYGDATKPSYAFRQDWGTGMFRATYNTLGFSTAGNERVRINSSGNVGIGTTSPSHLLDVGTSGAYCNGGAWVDGSSKEYKENIAELGLGEAVNALRKLVPVTYNYKANTDEKYVGFVAEDVPELVAMKDRKGLSPMDIVAVLTKVVQEQQKKIELLEAQQKELEELKAKWDKLTK